MRLIMFTLFGPYFVRDVRYWPIYILKSFFWLRKYWSNFKLFYHVDATLTLILFSKSYFSGKAFWKRFLHKFWAEGARVLSRSRITPLKSPQIVWFYLIILLGWRSTGWFVIINQIIIFGYSFSLQVDI